MNVMNVPRSLFFLKNLSIFFLLSVSLNSGSILVMKKIFVGQKSNIEETEHEAKILASLDHPHVSRNSFKYL